MAGGHRPVPRSDTDTYLALVVDEMEAVSAALDGIRGLLAERLPAPPTAEPDPAPDPAQPIAVELLEPAATPVKKTTPAKRQPPKRG